MLALPRGAMGLSAICDCGIFLSYSLTILHAHVTGGSRGGGGRVPDPPPPPPLKNHKKIGFLSSAGLDPLENDKATKPAFKVGPLSAYQQIHYRLSEITF